MAPVAIAIYSTPHTQKQTRHTQPHNHTNRTKGVLHLGMGLYFSGLNQILLECPSGHK